MDMKIATIIDRDRLTYAFDACDYLVNHIAENGRYYGVSAWAQEHNFYLSFILQTLSVADAISPRPHYRIACKKILDHFKRTQHPEGWWPPDFHSSAAEFKFTKKKAKERGEGENAEFDIVPGILSLGLHRYEMCSGDRNYRAMMERSFEHILMKWRPTKTLPLDHIPYKQNVIFVHLMLLFGLPHWTEDYPEIIPVIQTSAQWLKNIFSELDENEIPPFMVFFTAVALYNAG